MADSHFKENIKYIRTAYGFTQTAMAEYLTTTLKTYQSYEEGRNNPKNNSILNMCCILNLTFEMLIGINMAACLTQIDILRLSVKKRKAK